MMKSLKIFSVIAVAVAVVVMIAAGPAFAIADPIGDTFGVQPLQLDITNFDVLYTAPNLYIVIDFDGKISPPYAGSANSLYGYVDLDVDQNNGTGGIAYTDVFGTLPTGMGMDYYISIGACSSGTNICPVYDFSSVQSGNATAVFSSNSVVLTVPLSAIGG